MAEKIGFTNVSIYYSKEDGWWIESDQLDSWIASDSSAIETKLKELFNKGK